MTKNFYAIGLMSGTSADGVDLSLIKSDGCDYIENCGNLFYPYNKDFKQKIYHIINNNPSLLEIKLFENELTEIHAQSVKKFLSDNNILASKIDVIGFHGHTILHKPDLRVTWQIGNIELLQKLTNIKVIKNFRTYDMSYGGQGAPLAPIYHFHIIKDKSCPILLLNIGGVSNITYFDGDNKDSLQAFDICYGNSLSDELVARKCNIDFDNNGEIAMSGNVDHEIAQQIIALDIFHKKPIKSYDKNDFNIILDMLKNVIIEDALATLAFVMANILHININKFLPKKPHKIIIAGGGRKNKAIINQIKNISKNNIVLDADEIGLKGDFIESEAFAFLAIRRMQRLSISFEKTTGISNCN